jgi:hypothetical protein
VYTCATEMLSTVATSSGRKNLGASTTGLLRLDALQCASMRAVAVRTVPTLGVRS